MPRIALVFVMGGLLLGASRCGKHEDDGGTSGASEDGGSAGTAGSGEPSGGMRCGSNTCAAGEFCCNESCGICAPKGGFCTEQFCGAGSGGAAGGDGEPPPTSSDGPACGGIAGRPCPGLGTCVDDPSDSCNPRRGGADCAGICECTAQAKCRAGQKFDSAPEVCACVGGGDAGSSGSTGGDAGSSGSTGGDAGSSGSTGGDAGSGGGVTCGSVTCAAGEECCNASCSVCVPKGGACDQQLCAPTDPEPQRCGGFAAFPCPGSGECVDDPSDDCDPQNGGADCGGICECSGPVTVLCAQGMQWNSDPHVCACAPIGGSGGGEKCGMNTCAADQTCCNASCGICAPKGGACIQIACL